jgi:hypothetical protein
MDHLVHENPATPIVAAAVVKISACDPPPRLAVDATPGLDYVWYQQDASGGWNAVRTNASWTMDRVESGEFEVEARSTSTGCVSVHRASLTVVVLPVLELLTLDDMVAPVEWDGEPLPIQVSTSFPLESRHRLRWSTGGDGGFSSLTNASTTYLPGTNDVRMGEVRLTVTLEDDTSPCATRVRSATLRLPVAPVLNVRYGESKEWILEWSPKAGWVLQSCPSPLFDSEVSRVDVEVDGRYVLPSGLGSRFYRLYRTP